MNTFLCDAGILVGAIILLAVVVALIKWFIDHFDDLCEFLWERRGLIGGIGIAVLVACGVGAAVWTSRPERHRDYWCVPSEEPIPESVQATGRMAAAIQQGDAAWKSEMDKITALIDAERPGEFKLSKELVTTEALGRYVEKLLRLGESAVVSLEKMKRTAGELDLLLKEAPRRYREMAELARRFVAEEKRADIKEKYLMLGDIWEAKAKAAELHHGDVRDNLVSDLDDYLKQENLFLERLLTMLARE